MVKTKIELIIERGEHDLTGRVNYNNNLIVDDAPTVQALENQFKKLLFDFEEIDPESIEFEHAYDVQALFSQFDFLNVSKVAKHADMNPALLRHYAHGSKHPSLKQAKKLEETIHRLALQMQKASVYAE